MGEDGKNAKRKSSRNKELKECPRDKKKEAKPQKKQIEVLDEKRQAFVQLLKEKLTGKQPTKEIIVHRGIFFLLCLYQSSF